MYMLVAHRNMISVYDMTKKKKPVNLEGSQMSINLDSKRSEPSALRAQSNQSQLSEYSLDPKKEKEDEVGEWIDTVAFDHGQIREMLLKKDERSKKKNNESSEEEETEI